jgi:hypothetical protein
VTPCAFKSRPGDAAVVVLASSDVLANNAECEDRVSRKDAEIRQDAKGPSHPILSAAFNTNAVSCIMSPL